MCGPSHDMENTAAAQSSFAKVLTNHYNENFDKQSAIMDHVNHSLQATAEGGASQHGFSAEELAAKNSQAINTTGAAYSNAARAMSGQLAGRGGDSGLISGVDAQIKGSIAAQGAGQLAAEQNKITQDDWATGRDEYHRAIGGEMQLAQEYNPNAIAGEASGANASAFGMQDKIQTMKNQKEAAIAGGITSLAMDGLTLGTSGMFKGGMKALSGSHAGDSAIGSGGS